MIKDGSFVIEYVGSLSNSEKHAIISSYRSFLVDGFSGTGELSRGHAEKMIDGYVGQKHKEPISKWMSHLHIACLGWFYDSLLKG